MTFARTDRVLTRIWLCLAAGLALAGGMRLGAAVGQPGRAWETGIGCAPVVPPQDRRRRGDPVVHRDPTEPGNLGRARSLWPAAFDSP